MQTTDNAVVARMLSYGLIALEVDLALTRAIVNKQVTEADASTIERAREVIDFAKEGEELTRTLKLTSNSVLAMRVYDSVRNYPGVHEKIGESVLVAVDGLLTSFLRKPRGIPLDSEALKAATLLRDFFRFFRNDALGSCSGPMELLKTIHHSYVPSSDSESH
jgi:hypothetical protein